MIDILPQMITLSEAYIQVSPPDYSLIIVVLRNNRPDKRLLFKFFFFLFVCFIMKAQLWPYTIKSALFLVIFYQAHFKNTFYFSL